VVVAAVFGLAGASDDDDVIPRASPAVVATAVGSSSPQDLVDPGGPAELEIASRPPPTVPPAPRLTVPTTINPCSRPVDGVPPATGTDLRERLDWGTGELEVRNGTAGDAIVKLVTVDASPRAVLAVYIRSSDTFRITDIPDQQFRLVFSSGSHWSESTATFSCRQAAKEFEDLFDFSTSNWNVTLFGIPGGNAETSTLSPDAFNAY